MDKKLTYFDMAENDYEYLKDDFVRGKIGNIFCYAAQNVCERYLKHLISTYTEQSSVTGALRTHSIKVLRNELKECLPDFTCDWSVVLLVNGYYYDARYPGEDAMIAAKEDVEICWRAVEEVRHAVMMYLQTHTTKSPLITKTVMGELEEF